ncbi:unnamed protein product [Paramecium primaurelia]|uniref:Transmembrane protein n=1 Tax=Paramecium primaurelia TaxID=5886 RepID=A0A8S1PU52_PARPR|nr:unnamed protein product [Paramecium primaurelia]
MGYSNTKIEEPFSKKLRSKAIINFNKLNIKTMELQINKERHFYGNLTMLNQILKHYLKFWILIKLKILLNGWLFWILLNKMVILKKYQVLHELREGKAWVQFKRVDRFIKIDEQQRGSRVKSIIQEEKKRLSVFQPARLQKCKKCILKDKSYFKSKNNNNDYINTYQKILLQILQFLFLQISCKLKYIYTFVFIFQIKVSNMPNKI